MEIDDGFYMMGRKHSNASKPFLFILILFMVEFKGSIAETCQKIDDCSCKKSNGKVISLRAIDGGSQGPAIKGIPTIRPPGVQYQFDWNPCTTFSEGDRCKDMLVCQKYSPKPSMTYSCARIASYFTVNGDGTTTIVYQEVVTDEPYKRAFQITLKCDESKYPGETDGVTEKPVTTGDSDYSMTFKSKCACDDGCTSDNPVEPAESTGLHVSTGSTLLIVFFVLLFVYLIAGILIKKYKMGVESMPEMIPNYEFWAGVPSLVKDGIVFTCGGLKSGCTTLYQKCRKDGYGKV